jgi:hypothetical protein
MSNIFAAFNQFFSQSGRRTGHHILRRKIYENISYKRRWVYCPLLHNPSSLELNSYGTQSILELTN